jgi:hypothetical protein
MVKADCVNPFAKGETEIASARHIAAELSASWRKAHEARAGEIEAALMKQRPEAEEDERLLLGLAAHDTALAQKLGEAEVQLAERLLALVDNVNLGLAIAKTLRQVVAVRDGAARRTQDLLQTAAVLRGQRKLAEIVPLRRVG